MFGKPLSLQRKKLLNIIAERALKRGRKWTEAEKLENLRNGLRELNEMKLEE